MFHLFVHKFYEPRVYVVKFQTSKHGWVSGQVVGVLDCYAEHLWFGGRVSDDLIAHPAANEYLVAALGG